MGNVSNHLTSEPVNGFSPVEAAVEAIRHGQVVIVLDAEERENEGDFVCAAEAVTPEVVNFMLTHGKGLLSCAVLPEVAQRLDLPPMMIAGSAAFRTAYTVTVDHKSATTGITAKERCLTIRALGDPASNATDFLRPGHVHPLVAKEGGVLRRAGHTEASVDLARLAGLQPAGVVCEILNDEGDRATRGELMAMAKRHALQIITIEDLIRHRRRSECLVHRVAKAQLPTKYGRFELLGYRVLFEAQQPVVLTMGDLQSAEAPLVRIYSSCFMNDLLTSLQRDRADELHLALQMIAAEGVGVLAYLPREDPAVKLSERIKTFNLHRQGLDCSEPNPTRGNKTESREYGVGIQILKDLGLSRVRLMTNNPKSTDASIYGGFDLEVVEQIPIVGDDNVQDPACLATKSDLDQR